MKMIGKPADNVSKAKDPEAAKGVVREEGMELSDAEVDQVSGGVDWKPVTLVYDSDPPPAGKETTGGNTY